MGPGLAFCPIATQPDEPSSLSDLKEIGCKSAWPVHISPLSWAIERYCPAKSSKSALAQPNFRFDSLSPTGC
jgi:hypothetical protein